MIRYCKIKTLFGKDNQGKECICKFDNPGCPRGFNGECEEIDLILDRYEDLEECFKNAIKYKADKI